MEKILPIVNTVLALVAVIVCVIVLLQVNGLKATITESAEVTAESLDPTAIPLTELEEFNMDDSFILTFESVENEGKTATVVLKIGFAIHTTDEEAATAARTALSSQGKIIRDRIQPVLTSKDASYFTDLDKQILIKEEILMLVQELIGNQAVVDVYFINPIVSEK